MPLYSLVGTVLEPKNLFDVEWYFFTINNINFYIASLLSFTAWSIIGCYRFFRKELQYSNYPWVWLGFLLFTIFYIVGFVTSESVKSEHVWQMRLGIAFCLSILAGYVNILFEKIEFSGLKKLIENNKFIKIFFAKDVPVYFPTLAFSFILLVLYSITAQGDGGIMRDLIGESTNLSSSAALFLVFLNFIKDTAIVILINFSYSTAKTAGRALLFYAVLFYGALPTLLGIINAPQFIIIPCMTDNFIAGLLSVIIWIGVLGLLLFRKWNSLKAAQLES